MWRGKLLPDSNNLKIVGDFFVKRAMFQQEVADLRRRAAAREKIGEVGKEALHRAQKENLTHFFGHYHLFENTSICILII